MANLADQLKGALTSVVEGVGDVLSTTRDVTREQEEMLQKVEFKRFRG